MRKTFTLVAMVAALTVVPVTTALATGPSDDATDVETIDNPAAENQVSTWCEQGVKFDNLSGQTFTIPPLPDGSTWTKLILNGGQNGAPEGNVRSYIVDPVPAVGSVVTRPGAAVSNAILCYTPVRQLAPTPVLTPAPTPAPAPDADVSAAGPVPPPAAPFAAAPSPAGSSVAGSSAAAPQVAAVLPAAGVVGAAAPTQLPSTGASSWGLALVALASLVGGLGLVKLSRRIS